MNKTIMTVGATAIVLILSGCAQTTPIMEASKMKSGFSDASYGGEKIFVSDNKEGLVEYRVFEQAETGFISISIVRDNVEKRANKYCEQRNLSYKVISEQTSTTPYFRKFSESRTCFCL